MTSLAQYDRARQALAEATRIDEIVPLLDEVENVRRYARQINDQALLADANAYQMRFERKLGIVIQEAKKAGHFAEGRPKKASAENGSSHTEPFPKATLQDVGVSKKLSSRAQKRASISEQALEAIIDTMRERIASQNAVPVNGARSMAPGRKEPAGSLDFSPTPPWATRALIERVFPAMNVSRASLHSAHEPAAGEEHMAEVLREYFPRVTASDIHDYGCGHKIENFLDEGVEVDSDWIITNPPFKDNAEKFALKAIDQARVGVAIFARLQWLETVGRYERLFREHPPTQLAFFAERVNLCMGRWEPEGGTATAYIWLVWMKNRAPRPPYWIPPGCRIDLSRPDDVERFTTQPVIRKEHDLIEPETPHDPETGEIEDDGLDLPVCLRRTPQPQETQA